MIIAGFDFNKVRKRDFFEPFLSYDSMDALVTEILNSFRTFRTNLKIILPLEDAKGSWKAIKLCDT